MSADPEEIRKLLISIIQDRIHNHPRSLQKVIGPSEVGHPCDRWMAYKLADHTPAKGSHLRDKWRPTVGTFVHAGLAEWFEEFNEKIGATVFHVEEKVNVGTVYSGDGFDILGGCDLYVNGVVVDWKIVGRTTLVEAARHGASEQYRKQVHLYGRGWKRAGKPVEHVAVFYLPSSGTLDEAVFWTEPFNEAMAVEAVDRVTRIQLLVDQYGRGAAELVEGTDHYCAMRCAWWRPRSDDLSKGCPGVPKVTDRCSWFPATP